MAKRKQAATDDLVAERVRDAMPGLTNSEKRAAQALLANYPLLGLETVARFAGQAGSAPPPSSASSAGSASRPMRISSGG